MRNKFLIFFRDGNTSFDINDVASISLIAEK